MLTRCPQIACYHEFEVVDTRTTQCPKCRREFTVRPLDVWLHVDKQAELLKDTGRLASEQALKDMLSAGRPSVLAIVEDVRSLFNVGSIFRSADGAGISDIILTGISGTPPRKEIAKTSLGAEDSVNWLYAKSSVELLPVLRESGFCVLALEYVHNDNLLPDSILLSDALAKGKLGRKVCLIVGNEVTGVARETLALCNMTAHLPMRGMKESLNVSVAFGIAAYMLCDALLPDSVAAKPTS